jgi:hypothetical protein
MFMSTANGPHRLRAGIVWSASLLTCAALLLGPTGVSNASPQTTGYEASNATVSSTPVADSVTIRSSQPSAIKEVTASKKSKHSPARAGCRSLKKLTRHFHTEADLFKARPKILKIINKIAKTRRYHDLFILYQASYVRDLLSVDFNDPYYDDYWAYDMGIALQDLYTECVRAHYIKR